MKILYVRINFLHQNKLINLAYFHFYLKESECGEMGEKNQFTDLSSQMPSIAGVVQAEF